MKEKVIAILNEIKPNFNPNENGLIEKGILTSLDILQLISAIDDELDISIPPTKIKPIYFNSVDDIVRLLESLD